VVGAEHVRQLGPLHPGVLLGLQEGEVAGDQARRSVSVLFEAMEATDSSRRRFRSL
jgi:hypothetical protein